MFGVKTDRVANVSQGKGYKTINLSHQQSINIAMPVE